MISKYLSYIQIIYLLKKKHKNNEIMKKVILLICHLIIDMLIWNYLLLSHK